jgi:xanthine dehydrogenase accessory factor
MSWLAALADEIDRHGAVVRVTVIRADGSTPREVGAAMVVSADTVRGTIGGGALELAAIGHSRLLLSRDGDGRARWVPREAACASLPPPASGHLQALPRHKGREGDGERGTDRRPGLAFGFSPFGKPPDADTAAWSRDTRDFPLGPGLGQCCGGHTRLLFEVLGVAEREHLAFHASGRDPARALLLRPLAGGTTPYVTSDRKDHRPDWPLGITRTVRELLSGARPRGPLLVRGGKGGPAWFIEPLGRPVHRLYLYGAGHVGRAIVRVLEDLPFAVTWVDTSASRFPERIPPHAKAEVAANPAAFAGATESGAFHLVLTYSHALDLAICHSLLRRGAFHFLGLIGSATKRARFLKRLADLGIGEVQLKCLVCPIGLPGIGGKEPAAIAVAVAAQLVQLAAAAESSEPVSSSNRADAEG